MGKRRQAGEGLIRSLGPGPDLHCTASCWELVFSLSPGLLSEAMKGGKPLTFPVEWMRRIGHLGFPQRGLRDVGPTEHSSRKGLCDQERRECHPSLDGHGAH